METEVSKHVFRTVSDFSVRKKKKIENVILQVQFSPPHPGKGQIATPGKALQIKFPTPQSEDLFKWPRFAQGGGGGGGGDVEVSI